MEYTFEYQGSSVVVRKRDGTEYVVSLSYPYKEPTHCTCRGFRFRQYCKHQGMVFDHLQEKGIV